MTAASTKESPGAYDVLDKVAPDEPIFPLRASDPDAPPTITEWANRHRNRALRDYGESDKATDKELLAAALRKANNADEAAMEFVEWRTGQVSVEGERAGYQEVIRSAEEQAAALFRQGRDAAVKHLREAAYHLCEGRDALAALELLGEATGHDFTIMLARINGLADEHSPKRAGFESEPGLPLAAGEGA